MHLTSLPPHWRPRSVTTTGFIGPDRGGSGPLGDVGHLPGMETSAAVPAALEPLITIDELAAYLGLPKQTIYDWRVQGRGPRAYRIGKHLRYAVSDVRAWVAAQREPVSRSGG